MYISTINIQGLTKAKAFEVEKLLTEAPHLICISETHMKYKKIDFSPEIQVLHQMRKKEEKKGGIRKTSLLLNKKIQSLVIYFHVKSRVEIIISNLYVPTCQLMTLKRIN